MKKLTLFLLALTCLNIVQAQKNFTLEDITNKGIFRARSVYGLRSMKSGESYTVLKQGIKIEKYAYATGEVEESIFDLAVVVTDKIKRIDTYQFSSDERKILIATNRENIYRTFVLCRILCVQS